MKVLKIIIVGKALSIDFFYLLKVVPSFSKYNLFRDGYYMVQFGKYDKTTPTHGSEESL